jgi:hypothetical protein
VVEKTILKHSFYAFSILVMRTQQILEGCRQNLAYKLVRGKLHMKVEAV